MRRLVVILAVLALAACSPAQPTPSPPAPGATPGASVSVSPSATPSPSAPPASSLPSSAPTPIPTPDPAHSLPTVVTAKIDLTGPTGYRRATSAVADDGAIWVAQYQHVGAWLARIDPTAGRITQTTNLPLTVAPAELAAGPGGSLWTAGPIGLSTGGESTPNGTLARLDPATGRVLGEVSLALFGPIDPEPGLVWVWGGAGLQRVDAASLKVTATYPIGGTPASQCGLSVTQSGLTSTARYLDPASGAVTGSIDLGFGGYLLANDPVEGSDTCWAVVGPAADAALTTSSLHLAELGLESTMVVTGTSPSFRGDVRFAAGNFWLIANGTMTAIDPLTLAPLGPTWLLPPEVSDATAWTLLGAHGTLWLVGPNEALRVGISIPPTEAVGSITAQSWDGPFVPASAAFSDLNHGILVGATRNGAGAGIVAATSDGGHTWSARLLDTPPLLGVSIRGSAVLASVACRVDAPAACLEALIQSEDGGSTWTASKETGLDRPQLTSAGVAWAIYNPTISYAGFAASRDGGSTWTRYPSPCPRGFPIFEPSGISFPTATDGWLACGGGGAGGSSAKALFHTTNGGRTWKTLFVQSLGAGGVPFGPANDLLLGGDSALIDFLADGTGWLWTGDGLFATHDGGVSWQLLGFQNGAGGLQMNAMQLLTKTTALVLVTDGTTAPGHVTLQNTRDGGLTWTTIATWPLSP
jgi:hypothetical protein